MPDQSSQRPFFVPLATHRCADIHLKNNLKNWETFCSSYWTIPAWHEMSRCASVTVAQVFDLQQFRPGPVLRQIWQNFEQQKRVGDKLAAPIQGWAMPLQG